MELKLLKGSLRELNQHHDIIVEVEADRFALDQAQKALHLNPTDQLLQ